MYLIFTFIKQLGNNMFFIVSHYLKQVSLLSVNGIWIPDNLVFGLFFFFESLHYPFESFHQLVE